MRETKKDKDSRREYKDEYIGIKATRDEKGKFDDFAEENNMSLSRFARSSMNFFIEKGVNPEVFLITKGISATDKAVSVDLSPIEKELKSINERLNDLNRSIEVSKEVKSTDFLEIINKAIEEVVDEVTEQAIKEGHGLEAVFGKSFERIVKNISEELSGNTFRNFIYKRIREITEKRFY